MRANKQVNYHQKRDYPTAIQIASAHMAALSPLLQEAQTGLIYYPMSSPPV